MQSLDAFAEAKLAQLDRLNLRRELTDSWREDGAIVRRGERRLISFSCNDYLNLSQHPEVKAAVFDALARIRKAGRAAGILTTEPDYIAEARAAGAKFVGVGIDVLLYVNAIRALARQYRAD